VMTGRDPSVTSEELRHGPENDLHEPHASFLVSLAGDEASPRLFADADGNALSPMAGGASAKQPGETAGRLLRTIPDEAENTICWNKFAVLKSLFSAADFCAAVSHLLLNIDLHLIQIAQFRASRDFGAVARQAHDIARIAGNLGAISVEAAAHRLERACQFGDHALTYGLLSDLSMACEEANTTLIIWLGLNLADQGL
jgi:hypothetical protein